VTSGLKLCERVLNIQSHLKWINGCQSQLGGLPHSAPMTGLFVGKPNALLTAQFSKPKIS
jgi:hypothetical protein